jgi:hypothetical protein
MANRYPLIDEYSSDSNSTQEIVSNPYWVLAVVRLALPLSFDRSTLASVSNKTLEGVASRGAPLIISSDCLGFSVSNQKDNHVKQLTAALKTSSANYLTEILPGDWILAWIVNGEEHFENLLSRIQYASPNDPCNMFDDGLKFVGRVHNVRKTLTVAESGMKSANYTLEAYGFRELDCQFYYDESLASIDFTSQNITTWMTRIGSNFNDIFKLNQEKSGLLQDNISVIIPQLLDILVGNGIPQNINQIGQQPNTGASKSKDAPLAYLAPQTVCAYLGISSGQISESKSFFSYADLLVLINGVQSYTNDNSLGNKWDMFIPDKADNLSGFSNAISPQRIATGTPLLGAFLPITTSFCNIPVWEVLNQYLNPTINEMYTCLRVANFPQANDPSKTQGRIMPTVVLRQIPFTTNAFKNQVTPRPNPEVPTPSSAILNQIPHINITRFMDLPRWVMHETLVKEYNIGRSDVTRHNFVHVYGQDANSIGGNTVTAQLALNPPIRDDLDIQRSGMRGYMTTVACAFINQLGAAPSIWMALAADRLMGGQFTLNGTLSCQGITAPICEGDNMEWDGVVYHIESVQHTCAIAGDGKKNFHTTFTLVNGLRAGATSDIDASHPIYPGFLKIDNSFYNPGLSADDQFSTLTNGYQPPPTNETGSLAPQNQVQPNSPEAASFGGDDLSKPRGDTGSGTQVPFGKVKL